MWDEELFFYWLRSQVKAAGTGPSIAHPNKFCFLEENTMKKHDMMKKFTAAALSLTMMAGLAACSGGSSSASSGAAPAPAVSGSETGGTAIKVAVVKQMDHASLDEIANAITARLDEIAAEQGITIDYGQVYSGQGDETILNQIGAQVVADGVDVIIPVATTAAQLMTVAAEGTGIPVVYAAVSDPEQADLLDLDYVTGMSDALNTQFILDMMLAQDPEVQTVGLLYSLSEPNSTKPIAEAKEYLDGKGIAYKEYTANSVDEVIAAAGTLIADGVDAVFTPTDNKIMEAELAIAPELAEAGIPHYTGADSFVRNGAFTTCGVNYTDLGTQTADLAYQVASEGMDGMEAYAFAASTPRSNTQSKSNSGYPAAFQAGLLKLTAALVMMSRTSISSLSPIAISIPSGLRCSTQKSIIFASRSLYPKGSSMPLRSARIFTSRKSCATSL